MTLTISPAVADRLQKAANENHQNPSETLPVSHDAEDAPPAPYVRPLEPPAWVWELASQKPSTDGTNGMHRVWGAWPGNETDAQVNAALGELS